MTSAQAAAYVSAQSAAMLAELEGMKAANREREARGEAMAYGEDAFMALAGRFGVNHNAVIDLFQRAEA